MSVCTLYVSIRSPRMTWKIRRSQIGIQNLERLEFEISRGEGLRQRSVCTFPYSHVIIKPKSKNDMEDLRSREFRIWKIRWMMIAGSCQPTVAGIGACKLLCRCVRFLQSCASSEMFQVTSLRVFFQTHTSLRPRRRNPNCTVGSNRRILRTLRLASLYLPALPDVYGTDTNGSSVAPLGLVFVFVRTLRNDEGLGKDMSHTPNYDHEEHELIEAAGVNTPLQQPQQTTSGTSSSSSSLQPEFRYVASSGVSSLLS
jgi:hypothetical protein